MPKHIFNWNSRNSGTTTSITPEVTKLWQACQKGEEVAVRSSYGRPQPGYRGMFFHTCGCGYNFDHVQDRGFIVKDVRGNTYLVDAMAFHLVACHAEKLDAEERALLATLPQPEGDIGIEGLREILKVE